MTGYKRKNSKGIRNYVIVVYTVNCVSMLARTAARKTNVDVIGCEQCKVNELVTNKIKALITNPNVGGVFVIGQGCEELSAKEIAEYASAEGLSASYILADSFSSMEEALTKAVSEIEKIKAVSAKAERCEIKISDLIIGCECGGSDFTSGIASNPMVGRFNDKVIASGASVLFGEMYEAIGLKDLLVSRCITDKAKRDMAVCYDKYLSYAQRNGQFNISPGNIQGGLTTIEEKSMGAVCKTGSGPINGVLKISQKPNKKGLWYLDIISDDETDCGFSVSEDASSMILFAASGAQLCLLTSGRGHVVNNPIIPTIKITGNHKTYEMLKDDMDFDAGRILVSDISVSELDNEFYSLVLDIISGKQTKGEALGHREAVLNCENQWLNKNCL